VLATNVSADIQTRHCNAAPRARDRRGTGRQLEGQGMKSKGSGRGGDAILA
jgi:hypothetical protein